MKKILLILLLAGCYNAKGQTRLQASTIKCDTLVYNFIINGRTIAGDTVSVIMLASYREGGKVRTISGYATPNGFYDKKWRKIEFVWYYTQKD